MGVIYKLNPEISNFILKEKRAKPILSCRKLAELVTNKFQVKISKSQINNLIKKTGLSSRRGRTRKPKRGVIEGEGLGAFMLKAADALVGGIELITKIIEKKIASKSNLLSIHEALVYAPLFKEKIGQDNGLWKLINRHYSAEELSSYLTDLQEVKALKTDILAGLSFILEEVLLVRVHFSDESTFLFDAQFYALWSTPNIPYDFSTTQYKIKSYINKYCQESKPMVIFTSPGYEILTKDWLDFLVKATKEDKKIVKISFLNHKLKELETINLAEPKNMRVIFGLWPWQHAGLRKVEFLGDFLPFDLPEQNLQFYLAETIIQLPQPNANKSVTLKGAVLKKNPNSKAELVILSNLPKEQVTAAEIACDYLNRWPNFQESFKEFSRKIELFTYSEAAHQLFPAEGMVAIKNSAAEIKESFAIYLEALDAYVRWRFLPLEYRKIDLATMSERFYQLRARVKKRKNVYLISFCPPEDYAYAKDLNYAVASLNQQKILLSDGGILYFTINTA